MKYLAQTKIENKKYLYQFLPKKLEFLIKTDKIVYKDNNLKTKYLADIIHYMYCRYFFADKKQVNLSSIILRQKYGTNYNYYIEYLIDNNILINDKNYYKGRFSKLFSLNSEYYDNDIKILRWRNDDKIILKKWKKSQLEFEVDSLNDTKIINSWVKKELINDLYYVEIDFENASKHLLQMKEEGKIETEKSYWKNLLSVESIKDGTLFYIEDDYGRLHTNFTILKKVIRTEFIKINGEEVDELDIPNSQPMFLALLLKEDNFHIKYPKAYINYLNIVKNGKIYDLLCSEINIDRADCKKRIFMCLFGENKWECKFDRIFKKIFPEIFNWMLEKKAKDYRVIAHELQKKESKLIFDNIIYRIKKEIPDIKLFTVHDSIIYPKKYSEKVSEIFYNQVELLFS